MSGDLVSGLQSLLPCSPSLPKFLQPLIHLPLAWLEAHSQGILFEEPIEKMETRARYALKFPCSLHLPAPPSPPQLLREALANPVGSEAVLCEQEAATLPPSGCQRPGRDRFTYVSSALHLLPVYCF